MKYYKNEQWNDLKVKVSDTLPKGTEVDYNGTTVPYGWEQIEDVPEHKIVGTYTESNTDAYNCNFINDTFLSMSKKTPVSAGNSWYKVDLGFCRIYYLNGATSSITYSGNGWGYTPDISLPTGLSFKDDKMIFSGQFNSGDSAITTNCRINANGTYIYGGWQNKYSGSVSRSLRYHFHIIDFS